MTLISPMKCKTCAADVRKIGLDASLVDDATHNATAGSMDWPVCAEHMKMVMVAGSPKRNKARRSKQMSRKFESCTDVPTATLAKRLRELSNAIADGDSAELTMRVPAELDRDADVVLAEASRRLLLLQSKINLI